MGLKKVVTIRAALQHVADSPILVTDRLLDVPAYELVCRTLFEVANGAEQDDKRSQTQANIARGLIFDRLVGRRRVGSHPATRKTVALEFVDLTAKELGTGQGGADE
jgi:hypothetical protein